MVMDANCRTQIACSHRKTRHSHRAGLTKGDLDLLRRIGFVWPLFCGINDLRDADREARVIRVNKCYIGVNGIKFKSREQAFNEGSKDRDTGGISLGVKLFFLGCGNEGVKASRNVIIRHGRREIGMK
jgi:hypothetical protein